MTTSKDTNIGVRTAGFLYSLMLFASVFIIVFILFLPNNEIPPHVEYTPTEKGKSLLPVCYEIIKWGAEYSLDGSEAQTKKQ